MTTFLIRTWEATPKRIRLELGLEEDMLIAYRYRSMPNLVKTRNDDGSVVLEYDGIEYKPHHKKVEGQIEDFRKTHVPMCLNRGTKDEVWVLLPRTPSFPKTPLDSPPLVPAYCMHGLAAHPDGRPLRIGRSWVLSRYMYTTMSVPPKVGCAVCFGEVKPDDWPEGETAEQAAARALIDAQG